MKTAILGHFASLIRIAEATRRLSPRRWVAAAFCIGGGFAFSYLIHRMQQSDFGGVSPHVYRIEVIALGLLSAAAVLGRGLGHAIEPAIRYLTPLRRKPAAPTGILEQIEMLEQMWPSSGRGNFFPQAVNDDPGQADLAYARRVVVRMEELRREARLASAERSEEAMRDVLTDMQALRDQIKSLADAQARQRRQA